MPLGIRGGGVGGRMVGIAGMPSRWSCSSAKPVGRGSPTSSCFPGQAQDKACWKKQKREMLGTWLLGRVQLQARPAHGQAAGPGKPGSKARLCPVTGKISRQGITRLGIG